MIGLDRWVVCLTVGLLSALWGAGCASDTQESTDAIPTDVVGSDTENPEEPSPCVGTCISHGFGSVDVPAGSETDGLCLSWTLGNEESIFINAVITENDGMFHHSNWFWVPEAHWNMPDGAWSCAEQGFEEIDAAVFGGVIFAQSTQVATETQRFLPGAAIEVGPRARIIANSHVLNYTPDDAQTEMRVTLDSIHRDEVTVKLHPFRFAYHDLNIPAQARSEHFTTCDLTPSFELLSEDDFDLRLHYVLPHYHGLGDRFRLELAGGPRDGEALYDEWNLYGHPQGHTFDEPISLGEAGAHGFRFLCGYDNTTQSSVGWGIGDQEMCVMLGFAESAVRYDLKVDATDALDMNDEGTYTRTGPCRITPIPAL